MNHDCIVYLRDGTDHDFLTMPYQHDEYLYDAGSSFCASHTSHIQTSSVAVHPPSHPLKPNYPQGHPFGPAMSPLNPEVEAWLAALRTGQYPVVTVPVNPQYHFTPLRITLANGY